MNAIKVLSGKLNYYRQQESKYLDAYITSTKRSDRDMVVKTREKVKTLVEVLDILKKAGICE
jgi:lauroyl/myristoyl acyltransferase